MGIRISKVLGWGIELTLEEYDTMLQIPSEEDGVTFAGYFDYLDTIDYSDSMSEGLEKVLIRGSEIDVSQMTVFSVVHEFHENNSVTVVIVPITEAHIWARYDDSIDYYGSKGYTENSVQYLEDGIYPYSNVYMNKRTGNLLTGEELGKYKVYKILKEALREHEKSDEMLRDACGNKDISTADMESVVPNVPDSVKYVTDYLDLFVNKDDVTKLRPMLATYWV